MKTSRLPLGLVLPIVLSNGASPRGPSVAIQVPQLALTVTASKPAFFEGEPIYLALSLQNTGNDTAWVPPFEIESGLLAIKPTRDDGTGLTELRIWADRFSANQSRGDPLPPHEAITRVVLMQSRWGMPDSSRGPYAFVIPPGRYTVNATFNAGASPSPGSDGGVVAAPLTLTVRPRTPLEDATYQEVRRVRAMAWNKTTRSEYLSALFQLVNQRFQADSSDPFLPFLESDAIVTLRAVGLSLSAPLRTTLAMARQATVKRTAEGPDGAAVALAAYYDLLLHHGGPALSSADLQSTFAGTVLGQHERHRARVLESSKR